MNNAPIDEALLPLHRFLADLTAVIDGFEDDGAGVRMNLASLGITMPLVLDVGANADNQLALGAAPPLYYLETTVEQVHHSIKLTIVPDQNLLRE